MQVASTDAGQRFHGTIAHRPGSRACLCGNMLRSPIVFGGYSWFFSTLLWEAAEAFLALVLFDASAFSFVNCIETRI